MYDLNRPILKCENDILKDKKCSVSNKCHYIRKKRKKSANSCLWIFWKSQRYHFKIRTHKDKHRSMLGLSIAAKKRWSDFYNVNNQCVEIWFVYVNNYYSELFSVFGAELFLFFFTYNFDTQWEHEQGFSYLEYVPVLVEYVFVLVIEMF